MARIAGVDLPRDKRVEIGLTYIFGIGRKTAQQILESTGVNPDIRVKDLTEDDVSKLREYIDHNVQVEGDWLRSAATAACVTAKGFPSADSAPRPTRAPARDPRRQSPTRRNNQGGI